MEKERCKGNNIVSAKKLVIDLWNKVWDVRPVGVYAFIVLSLLEKYKKEIRTLHKEIQEEITARNERYRVFENEVARNVVGYPRDELTKECRQLYIETIHDF